MYRVTYQAGKGNAEILNIRESENFNLDSRALSDHSIEERIEAKMIPILAKYKENREVVLGEVHFTNNLVIVSGVVEFIPERKPTES